MDLLERRSVQVRKVLESSTFQETEVLKRLLDYLAKQALNHPRGDLKEYTVGVEAFGKPADYDPQLDSSVRVQAGKLRQKLDAYYRSEGADDELIVELPKGHFKLEFRPRQPITIAQKKALRWSWVLVGPVLAVIGLAFYLVDHRVKVSAESWTPEMEEFWRPFLSSTRPVAVAIGTPMFVKVGNSFFREPGINTWDTASKSRELSEVEHALGANTASPAFLYTGIGEAEGTVALERLLLSHGLDPTVRASSQLAWEDIERYNVIFVGPPKFNQQTGELPVQQDFEINRGRVHNLHPAGGEPEFFEEKWSPDHVHLEEGHALVSRLPGLHGSGDILVLAGSSTESTRAAVEFVTRPEYVASLIHQTRATGGLPKWFQLVLHVRYKSQTPIAMDLVAIRALK